MTKGDVSCNFSRYEFACPCGCVFDVVDVVLLRRLELLRMFFNAPVKITCGCRCHERNEVVEGSPRSQHLLGKAADIVVDGYSPKLVADYLEDSYPDSCGIGRYSSHTHFDVRVAKARWE